MSRLKRVARIQLKRVARTLKGKAWALRPLELLPLSGVLWPTGQPLPPGLLTRLGDTTTVRVSWLWRRLGKVLDGVTSRPWTAGQCDRGSG